MQKMRFGIIGCGGIAHFHAKAIGALSGAVLAAVTDSVPEQREAFGKKWGIPSFPDVRAMLSEADVDIVSICTPSGFHAELAIQALKAGKNVVVEKPFAITRDSMEETLAAEKAAAGRMTVISQLRFADDVILVKKLIEEKALGNILLADLSMKYFREPSYYSGGWRGTIAMDGGGALINQGIHGVDLLRFLCGDVKKVHARKKTLLHHIEAEDTLCADFELENGGLGVLTATTSCFPGHARRLEICGTKGSLTLEESKLIRLETEGGHTLPEKTDSAPAAGATYRDPFAMDSTLHTKQLERFVTSLVEKGPPVLPAAEAAGTLRIIFDIYECK